MCFTCGAASQGCGTGTWEGGIHAQMGWSDARGLRVVSVREDGPSDEAGLEPGDVIVAIEGEPLEGKTVDEVRALLRGPVGTNVALEVRRGDTLEELHVERAPYRSSQLDIF